MTKSPPESPHDEAASYRQPVGPPTDAPWPRSPLLRLYLTSLRAVTALRERTGRKLPRLGLVHSSLWLGILGRRSLGRLDEWYYARTEVYADERHARRGLWPWEKAAIESSFPAAGRLLVAGVGAGREALALTEHAHSVDAFDCNRRLLARARELAAGETRIRLHDAPRDRCPPGLEGAFDGIVVGWGAYHHVQGRERRVAFLRELAGLTREGAPILLSFFVRPSDENRFRRVARIANLLRRPLGRPRIEVGDVLDPELHHYFTEEEIESELAEAGWRMERFVPVPYGHAVGRRPGGEATG